MQLVHESRPQVRRDRLLPLAEVEPIVAMKKSAIYALMREKKFPACVRISARCVRWPESAVLQWVQDRIHAASANDADAKPDAKPDSSAASSSAACTGGAS